MTQTNEQKIASRIHQLMNSNRFQKATIRQVDQERILVDGRIGERGKVTARIDERVEHSLHPCPRPQKKPSRILGEVGS